MLAYLFVTLGYLGLISGRALLSAGGSLRASAAVHRGMLRRVLRAPVAWFEATPSGRLLNRFSSDVSGCMDSRVH